MNDSLIRQCTTESPMPPISDLDTYILSLNDSTVNNNNRLSSALQEEGSTKTFCRAACL